MKTITAVFKPMQMAEVKEALERVGINGITMQQVQGRGNRTYRSELYRGAEYVTDFVPKISISVTLPDEKVAEAVDAILKAAHTGRQGDGRITVSPVEQFWNIRTGEDEAAPKAAAPA